MTQINPYLTFNGNCREAMTFYQQCLGGELGFLTVGSSPMAGNLPPQMQDSILHSTLTGGAFEIQASDMCPENGLLVGNSVSLSLNCESEAQLRKVYEGLSEGGSKDHPLEDTFWGAIFGDLTDKYGNHWLLNFNKNG